MKHYILFTGHMIDAPNRLTSRFPPAKEFSVKNEIRNHLIREKENSTEPLSGISAAASGGDILFHEICIELNIPSEIYLALPAEEFRKTSVSFAGQNWNERFDNLLQKLPVHTLPAADNPELNVWERANQWMLQTALKEGGRHMTLIALWDGNKGDGKGGTEHMIEQASEYEGKVIVLNINQL